MGFAVDLRHVRLLSWLAAALYVHLRGSVRLRPLRQLLDPTTFLAPYNAAMYLASAVPRGPFLRVDRLPELAKLRAAWRTLRDEALALGAATRGLGDGAGAEDLAFHTFFKRGWSRFHLKWYGAPLPSAEAACPRTVALLREIPTVRAALFCVLPPGGRLGRHRDPFAGVLRYHLGLATPNSDACVLHVDGAPYSWRDGEDALFDETFVHEAWNGADAPRVVFFADVERPLRTAPMRALNRWVCRRVMPAAAARNAPDEAVGALNRVFGAYRAAAAAGRRFKAKTRVGYYAAKYAALALLAWALIF
ncbi:MAG TPA: aspartyl/asparaginyl beta-hydroxylase domain-containing protein [Planctomycetota bacterium]|nr:aspartyl/asparaginyl beta-hydroxylase domain-containing protein [Planctomycetota bacterium]